MNKSIIRVILVIIPLLAAVPAVAQMDNAFQSTSSMAGSGSQYASDPTISSNGMAVYGEYASSPNRGRTAGITNPDGDDDDDSTITPIGSALPALLLLAGAYTAFIALRRRSTASKL